MLQLLILISAGFFALEILLYIAMILGAPLASLTLDGSQKKLPKQARLPFTYSVCIQTAALWILLQTAQIVEPLFPIFVLKIMTGFLAFYLTVQTVKSFTSDNFKERRFIAPLHLISASGFVLALFC